VTSADDILSQLGADAVLTHLHAVSDDDAPAWEPPLPLGAARALPAFPADVLPGWLADMVTGVAEATQTPPDLPGCIALAVLSAAAGGRAIVEARPGWTEPVNIFVVVAMPPASRKSAVFRAMTAPLLEAEQTLTEQFNGQIAEAQISRRIARTAADKAAHAAASTGNDDQLAEAVAAALAAEAITIPPKPRLVADDITPEKAASILAEQGGRLAVLSAEGGIFATLAGRYSTTPNLEVFLKGHAGDMLRVDRQGRPAEHVDHPALTLGLAVQPEVIRDIAGMPGFRGKGLLARLLYSLPPSNIGTRRVGAPPVPEHVSARYQDSIRQLALTLAGWDDPARLPLTPAAAGALTGLEAATEPRLHPDTGDLGHIADWAGKYVGAVLRLAGLLHLAADTGNAWRRPITEETVTAAARLGDYFTHHATAAFDHMGADPAVALARKVLGWLQRTRTGHFNRRDAYQVLKRSVARPGDLDPALDVLEQHGWICRQPDPPRAGPGRRPSPAYLVHPQITDEGK
jgi:replicative DNA helicase